MKKSFLKTAFCLIIGFAFNGKSKAQLLPCTPCGTCMTVTVENCSPCALTWIYEYPHDCSQVVTAGTSAAGTPGSPCTPGTNTPSGLWQGPCRKCTSDGICECPDEIKMVVGTTVCNPWGSNTTWTTPSSTTYHNVGPCSSCASGQLQVTHIVDASGNVTFKVECEPI